MILRNLGVQDVTIREVIDLDPELLQLLPYANFLSYWV